MRTFIGWLGGTVVACTILASFNMQAPWTFMLGAVGGSVGYIVGSRWQARSED